MSEGREKLNRETRKRRERSGAGISEEPRRDKSAAAALWRDKSAAAALWRDKSAVAALWRDERPGYGEASPRHVIRVNPGCSDLIRVKKFLWAFPSGGNRAAGATLQNQQMPASAKSGGKGRGSRIQPGGSGLFGGETGTVGHRRKCGQKARACSDQGQSNLIKVNQRFQAFAKAAPPPAQGTRHPIPGQNPLRRPHLWRKL